MNKKKIKLHVNYSQIKCIVFDFDNTLKLNDELVKKYTNYNNLEDYEINLSNEIKRLQSANIKIFINTGRSFNSFVEINNFYYDYLCCNNGCEFYNKDNKLIYFIPIHKKDIDYIEKLNDDDNCKIRKYYPKDDNDKSHLLAVSIQYDSKDGFEDFVNELKNNLTFANCFFKYPKIRIVNSCVDKQDAIQYIKRSNKLSYKNICVVGDDDNDYESLKNNKSYTMKWQSKKIKTLNLKAFNDIIQFIKYIGV